MPSKLSVEEQLGLILPLLREWLFCAEIEAVLSPLPSETAADRERLFAKIAIAQMVLKEERTYFKEPWTAAELDWWLGHARHQGLLARYHRREEEEAAMPSSSKAQKKLMAAAAHNKDFAKKAGVSQKVAKDFNQADKAKAARKKG